MGNSEALSKMKEEKAAVMQGDAKRLSDLKTAGRLNARERIDGLFDAGSFAETDVLKKCGVVCGFGTVNGRPAFCFSQDVTDRGGAMCVKQGEKIIRTLNQARVSGTPVVMFLDSNGLVLEEGAAALNAYAKVMSALARLSGVCPLIACVSGNCCGTAAMMARVADITIQVKKSTLALSSLLVMQKGEDKDKDAQALFGAETLAAQGAVSMVAENEQEAFAIISELLELLPACNMEGAPLGDDDDLNRVLENAEDADAEALAQALADCGKTVELGRAYGKCNRTLLARVGGRSCGIVSQNGGKMNAADMEKTARFVRFCDCFQLPVITLCNTDGIEPPASSRQAETIRAAGQLMYAYAEATTVKVSVIRGNLIGNAYAVMGGGDMADVSYMWPDAAVAAVSAPVYERTLAKGDYAGLFGAVATAKAGLTDDCIDPADTRKAVIAAMEMMATKHDVNLPRKHGNLPL